jgi:peptidoglycan hydrolase CwlO-like protein
LKRSTKQSDDNVGQMSKQLDDVHSQLVIQLQNLNDTLVRLQAQLSTQKEALNQARAAEWGALGAMLLGEFPC